MSGCNEQIPVPEERKAYAPHNGFCEYYRKGSGDCTCGAAISYCDKEIVRGGKCEEHKIERRRGNWNGDRRRPGSTDTPPSCGNGLCHSEFWNGEVVTRHDTRCPDYGPGWA
jgi:hypothetical protein